MYKDFIIKNYSKTIEELLDEGLTFKQINEAVKSPKNFCKTFQDFLDEMPSLHCMFKEYIEDEASGMIKNIEDFAIAFSDYFDDFGWIDSERLDNGGPLTIEEECEDLNNLETYIMYEYKELAKEMNII